MRYRADESEFPGTYKIVEYIENEHGIQHILITLKTNHQYIIESDVNWLNTGVGTWTFDNEENIISLSMDENHIIIVNEGKSGFSLALKQIQQEDRERIFLEKIQ